MADDQIFLKDPSLLDKIGRLLVDIKEPVLEIGAGNGALTRVLSKKAITAVQMDPSYEEELKEIENVTVLIGKFQKLKIEEKFESMVSNLPFNQIMDLLIHTKLTHPQIKNYYVIVPIKFYEKFLSKSTLGFKIRHLFKIKKMLSIAGSCFVPKINFTTVLLKLEVKSNDLDKGYFSFLSKIKRPSKKIKQVFSKLEVKSLENTDLKEFINTRINQNEDEKLYENYLHLINLKKS